MLSKDEIKPMVKDFAHFNFLSGNPLKTKPEELRIGSVFNGFIVIGFGLTDSVLASFHLR